MTEMIPRNKKHKTDDGNVAAEIIEGELKKLGITKKELFERLRKGEEIHINTDTGAQTEMHNEELQ